MNCIALSVEQHGPQHFNCIYLFILLVVSHVSFLRLDIGYDTIYAYARSTTPKYGVTHRFFCVERPVAALLVYAYCGEPLKTA
jgi:hypothetical protein